MDCIKTARAKGLREQIVIYSHAWRNALIPIVTLVVGWFLGIFSGSLVIEQMFAINANNATIINAYWWQWVFTAIFLAVTTICINIVGDALRDVMDPKSSVEK